MKRSTLPPELFKTGQITPRAILKRRIRYSNRRFATVNTGCYNTNGFVFSFIFISAEYLKNHSKSQKNHKMENPILLDST
jgi:hypothetical protein